MAEQQIQIRAKDEDLKGTYSNMMQITHTKEEFVLDFFTILGQQGVLASRVIMSPGHIKRMIRALQENLQQYEGRFGQITPPDMPEGSIGFAQNK